MSEEEAISLRSRSFQLALSSAGGFHDAFVESFSFSMRGLTLIIGHPYFPSERKYGLDGVTGAKIFVRLSDPFLDFVELARVISEGELIFELSTDLEGGIISLVFVFGLTLTIGADLASSRFSWLPEEVNIARE